MIHELHTSFSVSANTITSIQLYQNTLARVPHPARGKPTRESNRPVQLPAVFIQPPSIDPTARVCPSGFVCESCDITAREAVNARSLSFLTCKAGS